MTPTKKVIVMLLYIIVFITGGVLLNAVMSERAYLKNQVLNDQAVEVLQGEIKRFKFFYAGRSGKQGKLQIKGLKKWVYLGKVSTEETPYFIKGNAIEIAVYRPFEQWLKRAYNVNHTLMSLGVKVNGQQLRTNESRKSDVMNMNHWLLAITICLMSMVLFGAYLLWKTPAMKPSANND